MCQRWVQFQAGKPIQPLAALKNRMQDVGGALHIVDHQGVVDAVVGRAVDDFLVDGLVVVGVVGDGVLENGRVGRDPLNAIRNTLSQFTGLDESAAHIV